MDVSCRHNLRERQVAVRRSAALAADQPKNSDLVVVGDLEHLKLVERVVAVRVNDLDSCDSV